jgi:anti-anti-sigma factor
MNIEHKETDFDITFILMDELLSQNVNYLADDLSQFVRNDRRNAIIDLSFVRKIDSMSIAALIRFKNTLAEKGRTLHLINPNETVLRVLELSGLEKFLLD